MPDTQLQIVPSILQNKCPHCRIADMYVNRSVFPLKDAMKTHVHCTKCKQRIDTGNNSAPGMNYAVSVVVYALGFVLYALIWDISYKDNSFLYSFFFATAIVLLAQPWIMRLSKTLYIYLFVVFRS